MVKKFFYLFFILAAVLPYPIQLLGRGLLMPESINGPCPPKINNNASPQRQPDSLTLTIINTLPPITGFVIDISSKKDTTAIEAKIINILNSNSDPAILTGLDVDFLDLPNKKYITLKIPALAKETPEKVADLFNKLSQEGMPVYFNVEVRTSFAANDPFYASAGAWGQPFPDLWGFHLINAGPAIDSAGPGNVVVAVIDTGVDYRHADLIGKVIKGPDYVNNDNDPADDHGHGTHAAGTIAAIANNNFGMVGVAPGAKILAI